MISSKRALVSEPKVMVTGVEGAGKTLFAVQQADLLTKEEGGVLYTLNIRGADPVHLPQLPFKLDEMAFNEDGTPVLDKETGDHLPKWATLPPGSVILVDEAHKVWPQRGPGRPPKWIEMLAEGRQFGIRFILLTQSPASVDSYLRDRISRHYHLERKGNMERATILEFDHCVMWPRTAWQERKDAQIHFWAYPKEYFGWYKSAKVHNFKVRIPWKIWAAAIFIPVLLWGAWNVYSKVTGVIAGEGSVLSGAIPESGQDGRVFQVERPRIHENPEKYLARFVPVVDHLPWSAPAFQGRDIAAEPDLFCASGAAGENANGEWVEGGCGCVTEQGTDYSIPEAMCTAIVAQGGIYNPHRPAAKQAESPAKLGEARFGPSSVPASTPAPTAGVGAPTAPVAQYGYFRSDGPGPSGYTAQGW